MTSAEKDAQGTRIVYRGGRPTLVQQQAILRVVRGPDEGASCSLRRERARVGTADAADLRLSDDKVSRAHLEIQVQDAGFCVQDLGSTNGTFYRGARVKEVMLGSGAEIRVGESTLRVEPAGTHSQVIKAQGSFGEMVGQAPSMQRVYGVLEAVAPTDVTVLIEGETGTGKELVAEQVHRSSPRCHHALCVVDCGALPSQLIEAELFGHERGAFTGAVTERDGLFQRAHKGTLFLDEIGELPLGLQSRLLRVLEKKTIRRVGSSVERRVDVRVIAATNRELEEEVEKGTFRADLFYRLAVVRVRLPALRERREDIRLLIRHFLWEAGCPDPDAVLRPDVLEALTARRWSGNVRELRNVVERAMLLSDGFELPEEVPSEASSEACSLACFVAKAELASDAAEQAHWLARSIPPGYLSRDYKLAKELLLNDFEQLYLRRLLEEHGRNISKLAAVAGIDRRMVRKLLHKHGLDRE
ncbi:MAG: sigma 54-dependent Fis family transcriptional regulator [Deltaproteobacteria bacterium]|nr:sigma 54-dependent Fis family transcriptional regulator [Deltaproteobacteria bacterium]